MPMFPVVMLLILDDTLSIAYKTSGLYSPFMSPVSIIASSVREP